VDTAAILRCRPATPDRWGFEAALTKSTHERTQAATHLQSLLDQRRRTVLTATPAELSANAVAVHDAEETVAYLDAAYYALTMGRRSAPDALPTPPPAPNPTPDARGFIYSRGGP